ncbi:helix-turn-helix domain-containing protein [Actinoallomurus spadix]|uniref:ArsR/SmtB family transcription factor n=1 Tax=Actinoallomurus spadix TaxID=79912 RepID=UPI00209371C4|nr:helix-turn-helix domain-containing protein [Actinoallomurus spadix]MCO5989420.1 helix-turn-helix domain-containing protein [Actinoallomurus spadix]
MADRPPAQEISDVAALRLLAHPLRRKIEQCLRDGPVNSATLARALGESTGSTSYHLRQLAKHGFIEEVPELSKGRERWWRAVPGDRRFPPYSRQTPEMRVALSEMVRHNVAEFVELFSRFADDHEALGEWADAFLFSRATVRLTLDEVKEFFEEYIALVYRFSRPAEETPPGARAVHFRLLGIPEAAATEPEAGSAE